MTLARVCVLNPQFENGFVAATTVIVLASLFCLFERDTHNYLTWRIYTIYPAMLQDSLLPKLSDHLYPPYLHAAVRNQWNGTLFANAWLAINAIIVALMIFHRIRELRASGWTRHDSDYADAVSPQHAIAGL